VAGDGLAQRRHGILARVHRLDTRTEGIRLLLELVQAAAIVAGQTLGGGTLDGGGGELLADGVGAALDLVDALERRGQFGLRGLTLALAIAFQARDRLGELDAGGLRAAAPARMSSRCGICVDRTPTVLPMLLPAVRSSPCAPFGPWHCELVAHERLKIGWMFPANETVGQPGGSHLHPLGPPPPPSPSLPPPAHPTISASASRSGARRLNARARAPI
jgi:hypothetical protein